MISYLYGLLDEQSVPSLQWVSRMLWGDWEWTGGSLMIFAIISMFVRLRSNP
jgi:hypothetical protein